MRVLEIGSLNVKTGGPAYSISKQMRGLQMNGIDAVCLISPCPEKDIIDNKLKYRFTDSQDTNLWGIRYTKGLRNTLSSFNDIDIINIQGCWTYNAHISSVFGRSNHVPYIIVPRGALYPNAMRIKWVKKYLAWFSYQKNDVNKAACIQATCIDEMKYLRKLGVNSPIAVIPNSYDVTEVKDFNRTKDDIFRVGYIGRLSPRKKVERLIYALNNLKEDIPQAKLIIMGADDEKYERFLKKEVERLGLNEYVNFCGFLRSQEKEMNICSCSVIIVPSDFENWGNVIPDALSRRIPVIASKGTPWEDLNTYGCGWWIDNDTKSIEKALKEASGLGADRLLEMGWKGRKMVEDKYSVYKIGNMLKELYSWILWGGQVPDFVYL